ncbi:MAG: hypothetical protein ABIO80_00635 [Sphingomicrobium sp.]
MNPFELVIAVVAMAMIMGIIIRRMELGRQQGPGEHESAESQRLREEVTQLKERLKVLERITVDKENSLAKEIESLRDR